MAISPSSGRAAGRTASCALASAFRAAARDAGGSGRRPVNANARAVGNRQHIVAAETVLAFGDLWKKRDWALANPHLTAPRPQIKLPRELVILQTCAILFIRSDVDHPPPDVSSPGCCDKKSNHRVPCGFFRKSRQMETDKCPGRPMMPKSIPTRRQRRN
jgi:hypothetical protein